VSLEVRVPPTPHCQAGEIIGTLAGLTEAGKVAQQGGGRGRDEQEE